MNAMTLNTGGHILIAFAEQSVAMYAGGIYIENVAVALFTCMGNTLTRLIRDGRIVRAMTVNTNGRFFYAVGKGNAWTLSCVCSNFILMTASTNLILF